MTRRLGRTLLLFAAAGAGAGCGPPPAQITAQGMWADGEAIDFRAPATLAQAAGGRTELIASHEDYTHVRLQGIRLAYDPAQINVPGRYQVDPEPLGRLELYCIQPQVRGPSPLPQSIEFEVSSGTIVIDTFPDRPGRMLAGHFEDIVLQRQGILILRLDRGEFYARLR